MSFVEILVVGVAVGLVVARWAPVRVRRGVTVGAAALAGLSAVIVVGLGVRWQMVPVLAGAVLAGVGLALPFAVGSLSRRGARRPSWRARWWVAAPGTAVCLLLVAAGPVAAWAFPVPEFPAPSGPYATGTVVLQWTDQDRPEPATAAPDDHRIVVAQLWYPARPSPAGAARAPYFGRTQREARTVAQALAGQLGLPGFILDALPRARTRSVAGAPVAAGRFPVVLFSPGIGSVRGQNTAWAEELAGRGYVVAGLDHPYDSAAVVLDDSRVIHTRARATGDAATDERLAADLTATRAGDLSFALTRLDRLDRDEPGGPFAGRLDVGRAAATGHSLGGGAALLAARQDTRFAAVIDVDGYPHDPAPAPFPQPALALTSAIGLDENPRYLPQLTRVLTLGTATTYRLTIPGMAHFAFTDAPFYLPPVPFLVGDLGDRDALRSTTETTAAFLDVALRGGPGDLPSVLARFGDVAVHRPGRVP
ncbi:alpha/beta hydrolase family protein [Nonomuraea antimicrobica]|uniref:alpha/beta hydrolase family protein n=1 Tax=Nonomuraea antimicrobica TaxID=561173 RepID=UPI0031ED15A0